MIKKILKNIDIKYFKLQILSIIFGCLGTITLSYNYLNKYVYLYAMGIFMIYNILEFIHFTFRRMYIQSALFLFYLVIGIYGMYKYIMLIL